MSIISIFNGKNETLNGKFDTHHNLYHDYRYPSAYSHYKIN